MKTKQRIVIIAATSSIAEHCARLWVQRSEIELTLVGRSVERLERIAADLRVRSPKSEIHILATEFTATEAISSTVDQICAKSRVDIVLIAQGSLIEQIDCQNDLNQCRESLEINAISPVLFAEGFARHMEIAGHGTLALIGSVAGDRGRKSNYIYGSAKGLVERYAQGLGHRFAASPVKIVLIKPGPTDTPMTAHLKNNGAKLAPVETVAAIIVSAINRGQSVVYAPLRWRVIMWVISHLPNFVFNRINI